MQEVSIYVAAITAAAGLLGAAIPQAAVLARDVRQAERDRRERQAEARRRAYVDLLRAAGDLRTRVADAARSHGEEIVIKLGQVRECAERVALDAVNVGLLAPEPLIGSAEQVATAADRLAATAAKNTDMRVMAITIEPDYAEFDESVAAFRRATIAASRGWNS